MKILNLIETSRKMFIQSAAETAKLGLNSKGIKLYTEDGIHIFGVGRDIQKYINYDELRFSVSYTIGFKQTYPEMAQIVGDSQLFSVEGTQFASEVLHDFVHQKFPQSIILFGFTGKHDKEKNRADANHILSLMVDNKKIETNRVLANMVDYHTPLAINSWPGVTISENIKNYTLVFTEGEPQATFTHDTPTTDGLTNSGLLCLEGGVQSLLQAVNILIKNVPVYGVMGLRDLSDRTNPLSFHPISGKPYLSAAGFLQFIKEKTQTKNEIVESDIKQWTDEYLKDFALTNPKGTDAGTKPAAWEEAMSKMITFKIWEKLNYFNVIARPTIELQNQTSIAVQNDGISSHRAFL